VATLISSSPCGKSKSNWSSMRWEIWYHLIPVDSPRQFEVPWAWEFWYCLNLVDTASQFEVPWGWNFDIILTLWTL
jgi:hypothetical protein